MLDERKAQDLKNKVRLLEEELLLEKRKNFSLQNEKLGLLSDLEHAVALLSKQKTRFATHSLKVIANTQVH